MKNIICLFVIAAVALASCTKTTNNTTVNEPEPAFIVSGIHNTSVTNGGTYTSANSVCELDLTVAYKDSMQENVTLSLSSLPSGITMDTALWYSTGIPTFSTSLVLYDTTSSGATPGTYPITITATSSSYSTKSYTFNLKINQAPPCTSGIIGTYVSCLAGCTSTGYYVDNITNDATVSNKIWFSNFANLGIKIYGNYSCSNGEITIPSQSLGGVTYSGNLGSSGHYLSGNYIAGSTTCSITME